MLPKPNHLLEIPNHLQSNKFVWPLSLYITLHQYVYVVNWTCLSLLRGSKCNSNMSHIPSYVRCGLTWWTNYCKQSRRWTLRFWNVFPSMKAQELVQRSGFDRTASAFSSAPLDNPTADHQVCFYSLKITQISSQLKLLQKLLCLLLYMNFKRR